MLTSSQIDLINISTILSQRFVYLHQRNIYLNSLAKNILALPCGFVHKQIILQGKMRLETNRSFEDECAAEYPVGH